ncbi:MAG: hypothetical protein ACMUIP_15260 [bacterium]
MKQETEEKIIFEKMLELIKVPPPDTSVKKKIMKTICFLMVMKEIALFSCSIPGVFLDKNSK